MAYWWTGGAAAAKIAGEYLGGKAEQESLSKGREAVEKGLGEGKVAAGMADPFQEYRAGTAKRLNDIITGKADFKTDPGYQFVYNEAMRGTSRQMSASGYNNSGNAYGAFQRTGAGIASQEYGNIIDRLTNLAGASSQNAAQAGTVYGNSANTYMSSISDLYSKTGASKNKMMTGIGGTLGDMIGGFGG